MAQDIVSGLFGLTPFEAQQQYQQGLDKSALDFASLDPLKIPAYLAGRAGQGLGGMLAESQGMVRPDVAMAQERQAALQGLDLSNSQSILAKAQQVQDPQLRMRLMLWGQERAKAERQAIAEQQKLSTETAFKTAQMTKDLALAEKALRENPNLAVTEVGVKGRPGWMQRVLFDKTNPKAEYQELGEPYQTPQAMKISMGGGAGRAAVSGNTVTVGDKDITIPKNWKNMPVAVQEAWAKRNLPAELVPQVLEELKTPEEKEAIKQAGKDLVSLDKDVKSSQVLVKKLSEVEFAMADSLGVTPDQLSAALSSGGKSSAEKLEKAVGFIDQYVTPLSQAKANILSHIKRLQNLAQTGGLQELRASGVAPGSITEREWPKFQADLANLDTGLDGPELVKQYVRIYQKILDARQRVSDVQRDYTDKLSRVGKKADSGWKDL